MRNCLFQGAKAILCSKWRTKDYVRLQNAYLWIEFGPRWFGKRPHHKIRNKSFNRKTEMRAVRDTCMLKRLHRLLLRIGFDAIEKRSHLNFTFKFWSYACYACYAVEFGLAHLCEVCQHRFSLAFPRRCLWVGHKSSRSIHFAEAEACQMFCLSYLLVPCCSSSVRVS